jgi:virginiamycin B lyase
VKSPILPVAAIVALLTLPAAAPGAITIDYIPTGNSPSDPSWIAPGPDGNMWFVDQAANKVGYVTADGTITQFNAPGEPYSIAAGFDGAMWYTTFDEVHRMTLAGAITNNYDPPGTNVSNWGIRPGPDGRLWFTEFNESQVAAITMGGVITEVNEPGQPTELIAGPDGNMWIPGGYGNDIVKMPTSMAGATSYPVGPSTRPGNITLGADGNLWFTELEAGRLGRITASGTITEFPVPGATGLVGIAAGPDGNIWFGYYNGPDFWIGRADTSGSILNTFQTPAGTDFDNFSIGQPGSNTVWFAESGNDKIGRITIPPDPVPAAPDKTASDVQDLRFQRRAFAALASGPSVIARARKKKAPRGSRVSYTLAENATVVFTVERATKGRRKGQKCLANRRKGKRCTIYRQVKGSFTHTGKQGSNSFKFSGRVGAKKLRPANYRLVAVATDTAGNRGKAVRKSFRIRR